MRFDLLSFLGGFAAAALIALGLFLLRRRIRAVLDLLRGRWQALRESLTGGADRRQRADVVRQADASHLAAPLFSLDRILIPPRLLVPPAARTPDATPDPGPAGLIPYMPDWPELAAAYRLPTLSLEQALRGEANLLFTGRPGAGKTVCLALIAARAAAGDPTAGGEARTPFFVHAGDLALPVPPKGALADPLIAAAKHRASTLTASALPAFLQARVKAGHALLLLDGLDELPRQQLADVADWLGRFMAAYPGNRILAAGPAVGFAPLTRLGFVPLALATWTEEEHLRFLTQWGEAWQGAHPQASRQEAAALDPVILTGWLSTGNGGRTPLEATLRTWAAYAGDVRGPRPADGMESYLRRRFPYPAGRQALEALAAEQVSREEFGIATAAAVELLRPLLPTLREAWKADTQDLLIDLADRGLLFKHPGERYSLHPSLAGMLAASALLAGQKSELLARDYSPGALWQEALPHFAAQADPGPLLNRWLAGPTEVYPECLLNAARWLRDAPPAARWRSEVLRRLAQALLNPDAAAGMRGRAVAAFVAAREANAPQLFRQAVNAPDHRSRLFAALGLGALRDASAVALLARRLADDLQEVRRAVCLALAAIGSGPAVETLAQTLLNADEEARRAAAEALAFHGAEGHAMLKDALAEPDLLVRRAAIYGLRWVDEVWVEPALREAQVHDSEWIIRSSAEEVLHRQAGLAPAALEPPAPPHELGWLLAFAAARGTGAPPGPAAVAMLVRASHEGTPEERAAAVQTLGALGVEGTVGELYRALAEDDPEVRDVAFEAVAATAAALGQRLPPPPPGTPGV